MPSTQRAVCDPISSFDITLIYVACYEKKALESETQPFIHCPMSLVPTPFLAPKQNIQPISKICQSPLKGVIYKVAKNKCCNKNIHNQITFSRLTSCYDLELLQNSNGQFGMESYICTSLYKTQRAFFEARKNPNYAHGLNFKRRAIAAAEQCYPLTHAHISTMS